MLRFAARANPLTRCSVALRAAATTTSTTAAAAAAGNAGPTSTSSSATLTSVEAAEASKSVSVDSPPAAPFNPYDSKSINALNERRLMAEIAVDEAQEEARRSSQHKTIPDFFYKGRRGSEASEYYVGHNSAGHPDPVAEYLDGGRPDKEWMWLRFLCFICVTSTVGTWAYQLYFSNHVKYFKDEPWAPTSFRY